MQIKIGHYVSIHSRIYRVRRIEPTDLLLTNVETLKQAKYPIKAIRPLWLQVGDEVIVTYSTGQSKKFILDVILYDTNWGDYCYVLYNHITPNELLNSKEVVVYIDKFL